MDADFNPFDGSQAKTGQLAKVMGEGISLAYKSVEELFGSSTNVGFLLKRFEKAPKSLLTKYLAITF